MTFPARGGGHNRLIDSFHLHHEMRTDRIPRALCVFHRQAFGFYDMTIQQLFYSFGVLELSLNMNSWSTVGVLSL